MGAALGRMRDVRVLDGGLPAAMAGLRPPDQRCTEPSPEPCRPAICRNRCRQARHARKAVFCSTPASGPISRWPNSRWRRAARPYPRRAQCSRTRQCHRLGISPRATHCRASRCARRRWHAAGRGLLRRWHVGRAFGAGARGYRRRCRDVCRLLVGNGPMTPPALSPRAACRDDKTILPAQSIFQGRCAWKHLQICKIIRQITVTSHIFCAILRRLVKIQAVAFTAQLSKDIS